MRRVHTFEKAWKSYSAKSRLLCRRPVPASSSRSLQRKGVSARQNPLAAQQHAPEPFGQLSKWQLCELACGAQVIYIVQVRVLGPLAAIGQLVIRVADAVRKQRRAVVALADGKADAMPGVAQAEYEGRCGVLQ